MPESEGRDFEVVTLQEERFMLLSLMRRHARSWLIKFLIAIIAVVFIFYFGYSFTERRGLKVAYVNGEVISDAEYQKAFRNLLEALQKEYKSVWNENLIEVFDLKNRALEGLIDEKLLSQEARRIGLEVTEKEIQDQIKAYPAFQFKGGFDVNRYRSLLQNNRMNPEDFEAAMAQGILQQKLKQVLLTLAPISEQEVLDHYTYLNRKVKIRYIRFSADNYRKSVDIGQGAMEKYFDEHKEEYRVPEKIKVAYIVIDPVDFKDKVAITDEQVKEYYEYNLDMFKKEKQVKARQILFKIKEGATEEEEKRVKEKAQMVLEKARAGEDFAGLAKAYSEDPTGKDGGDLGYFGKGNMIKPFEDAAFKMKKGEISDLVRTSFGYHIIKVEDVKEAQTESLEEAREQISKALITGQSAELAHEKAQSLLDRMPYDVNLEEYGKKHGAPVRHTDYFSQIEPIPGIGEDQRLRESIFSLKTNEVSELFETNSGFYIMQVTDKKPAYLPEIKEVSDKVKADFTTHLSRMKAKSAAEAFLKELREGKDWDELAKKGNLKSETTDLFGRQALPPQIGFAPGLEEAIFSLGEDKRYPDEVFDNGEGAIVFNWEGEKGVDEKKYIEEKENYRNSLMFAKQQILFRGWLDNLKVKADIDRTPFDRFK